MSGPAVLPTQHPVQWVLGLLPQRLSGQGMEVNPHLHLMPRFRMYRPVTTFSNIYSQYDADILSTGTSLFYLNFSICLLAHPESKYPVAIKIYT